MCFQLNCGRASGYEKLKSGKIKSVRVGNTRQVFQDSIDAYVEELRESAGEFERGHMRGRASTGA
jgi:excisionase family DNA binding protein